jgi:hypothetical protein
MELPIPFYGTKLDLSSQSRFLVEYVELSFIARKIAIVLFVAMNSSAIPTSDAAVCRFAGKESP